MARKKIDWIIGIIIFSCLFLFLIFVFMMIFSSSETSTAIDVASGDRVGVVELVGVIYDSKNVTEQLDKYAREKFIKAIVLHMDSPGGSVAASQELYQAVRRVREGGKPIITSMNNVAASGAYYTALGSSKIMANPGTTTGSIGVLAEFPNFTGIMDKIGVHYTIIKSGEYKDTGSPFRDFSTRDVAYLQNWVDNAYNQFLSTVATERKKTVKEIRPYADGRVYTGQQAYEYGLIDTLGTFRDAIYYAAQLGGIKGEPKIYQERKRQKVTPLDLLFTDISRILPVNAHPSLKYQWLN